MDNKFYEKNRESVLKEIKDNSVVLLFAGNAPKKTGDEKYQFTPNRNFYYLTGVDEENHILVMSKINGEVNSYLFIKEIDPVMEKWIGKSIRKEEAIKVTGIKDIKYLSELNDFINKLINLSEDINIYLDLERDNYKAKESNAGVFAKKIIEKYPQVNIKNLYRILAKLRLVKSKEEVDKIKKAIDITIEGIELLMSNAKAGMKEYELEAYFDFKCKSSGVKDFAFKTIAATGKNATILHYVDNNSEMKNGDLILFDLGAQYKYYNADISRTFPVSGKFTERQKAVYNAVLRVNEKIIKLMKPNVKFLDINKQAKELIAEECINLGLIKDKEKVDKYYFHSIGHSLGMDTHDIDMPNRDVTFKEGMIYTVEPGIYIEEEGIGIRIEDDVLITNNGNEVLTKNMIKTVEDIEKFMAYKR